MLIPQYCSKHDLGQQRLLGAGAANEEIKNSVEQMASISSETAQALEQAARAVADLAQQSQVLQSLIANMKKQG